MTAHEKHDDLMTDASQRRPIAKLQTVVSWQIVPNKHDGHKKHDGLVIDRVQKQLNVDDWWEALLGGYGFDLTKFESQSIQIIFKRVYSESRGKGQNQCSVLSFTR